MDVIVIGIDTVLDIHSTVVVFIPLRNTHAENDRDNWIRIEITKRMPLCNCYIISVVKIHSYQHDCLYK